MPHPHAAQGFVDLLTKLSALDTKELERSVQKLEKLEADPPEPKQLSRYAMLGAGITPVTTVLGDVIEGSDPFKRTLTGGIDARATARRLAGKSITGAITTGLIPVIRHGMDRRMEMANLRDQLSKYESSRAAPLPSKTLSPPSPEMKVATALIPGGTSPAARLASSRKVGLPRMTNLTGASIHQTVGSIGGAAQPGATKGVL